MITLFQYSKKWGGMNVSPFCFKTELTMQLMEIPFKSIEDPSKWKAPKNKLPCIEDEGVIVADSSFISEYLQKKYNKPLNLHLSKAQKAIFYSFKILIEEHLYWLALNERWFENPEIVKKVYFNGMPEEIINQIYAKTKRDFDGTGLGLHSREELNLLGKKALEAIENLISEKTEDFIFGQQYCELDIILFTFLFQIYKPPVEGFLKTELMKQKNTIAYLNFLEKIWNVK